MIRGLRITLLINVAIALAYLALGKLGLSMSLPPGYATAVWPPTGIAFASCVIWGGARVWPGILLGAWLTNATVNAHFDLGWLPWAIAGGSTLQALVGEKLLRYFDPAVTLDRPARVMRFTVSSVLACVIAALIGNLALYLKGYLAPGLFMQSFITWWLGDALGVQIFTPITLVLFDRRTTWNERRLMVGLPLLLTFVLFLLVYYYVRASEESQLQNSFRTEAELILQGLNRFEQTHLQAVSELGAFLEADEDVTHEEFARFSQRSMRNNPGFSALEWAPLLQTGDEAKYAQWTAQRVGQPLTIHRPANWHPHPAGWLAPITYLEPYQGNRQVLGLDLMGEPARASALIQAMKTGQTSMTEKIRLTQNPGSPGGLLMIDPVFKRDGSVKGFCIGVVDMRLLVEQLNTNRQLIWRFGDIAQTKTAYLSNASSPLPEFTGVTFVDRAGVYYHQTLQLADRQWQIVLHKPYSAFASTQLSPSLLILFVVLAASALLGNLALIISGDRHRIAVQVNYKTAALTAEISRRELIEAQLRESEHRYRLVFELTPLPMWIYEQASLRFLLVNTAATQVFGYTQEEFLNLSLHDVCLPEDLPALREYLDRLGQRAGQSESMRRKKDGTIIEVATASLPMEFEGHACRLAVVQDITERKQTLRELEAAKEAAEAANVAKSRFLATMSHEIRTPMNGVLSMAQLLMQTDISETERRDYARTIFNSGEALLSQLGDVLDFSKIEAGRVELERAVYAPRQLLNEVATLFGATAHQKKLAMTVDSTLPAELRCWGDPFRLRQILANLISNALKFTAQGTVTLGVAISANGIGQPRLRYTVTDTGIGIAPDKQSALFDAFTQADTSITRRYGGSGLGLAICRSLVELMGGEIGVESRDGLGATFWFQIPFERVAAVQESRSSQRMVWNTANPAAIELHPKKHILVVEDNALNQRVASTLLTRIGHDCVACDNGRAAMDLLRGGQIFDLILMDCHMPEMDGYEATQHIRAWETAHAQPRTPIVALTADAFEEDRDHCYEVGMDDFLTKPIHLATLEAMLGRWLPRATTTESTQADSPDSAAPAEPVDSAAPAEPVDRAAPAASDQSGWSPSIG